MSVGAPVGRDDAPNGLTIVVTTRAVREADPGPTTSEAEGDLILDPADEYAVEVGLRLREAHGGDVVLASVGSDAAVTALRKGLALGADRAILVDGAAHPHPDALQTAMLLAWAIRNIGPTVVICGTESYDGASGLVPSMLAELLDLPELTFAKAVTVTGSSIAIDRQTATGRQRVIADLPALVTVTAGVGEARFASLKGLIAAQQKPLDRLDPTRYGSLGVGTAGIDREASYELVEFVPNPARKAVRMLSDEGSAISELVTLLRRGDASK